MYLSIMYLSILNAGAAADPPDTRCAQGAGAGLPGPRAGGLDRPRRGPRGPRRLPAWAGKFSKLVKKSCQI